MFSRRTAYAFLVAALTTATAWGHHAMSALFDFEQRFTVTGTATRLDWRNPHIYLYVGVEDDEGTVQTWAFEGPSPVHFRRNELAEKADFESAIGHTVIVDASRARDGSRRGLIRTITLPDGTLVPLCPDNC